MSRARILVADDEKEILISCRKILQHAGFEVVTAADGAEALELLKASRYDLFFVDLKMPGRDGMEILSAARLLDAGLTIIMFTAYATLETAVEAVKRGAFDYLAKPFTADHLLVVAERALRHRQLLDENLNLREQLAADMGFDRILGTSEAMQKVFRTLQKVMRSDANILLQGETGTGRNSSPGQSMRIASVARSPLSRSIAQRCPRICWKASSSGTKRGHSPEPTGPAAACWSWRTRELCSWMRLENFLSPCKPSYCGRCRSANCGVWAEKKPFRWTSGSSRRPTATCAPRLPARASAKSCITA